MKDSDGARDMGIAQKGRPLVFNEPVVGFLFAVVEEDVGQNHFCNRIIPVRGVDLGGFGWATVF